MTSSISQTQTTVKRCDISHLAAGEMQTMTDGFLLATIAAVKSLKYNNRWHVKFKMCLKRMRKCFFVFQLYVEKQKGETLGVVIVESGWGSILPTVILASMLNSGPAARSGKLSVGDQIMSINDTSLVGLPLATCQGIIKVEIVHGWFWVVWHLLSIRKKTISFKSTVT